MEPICCEKAPIPFIHYLNTLIALKELAILYIFTLISLYLALKLEGLRAKIKSSKLQIEMRIEELEC